ncbi:methyltransferase type 11 [Methylobacterium sp. Leaf399]|uniref:class I SAM-dependent methyltransferase n=1 Tax=Methylobacterium sp. Leaf399 TaxID=1736364 RepID=UPI0007003C33|nr:class I SAM-dependent methyltransferase [Methylobacterium sp. Leaf399]KQT07489.1 methyltransferase type 11 [Methylobacterium sp. Leaf399]
MAETITQAEYWNGDAGRRWARNQRAIDTVFAPLTQALFAGAVLRPDSAVLDVGCGAGDCAIRAARDLGARGRVVAADVSAPLLAVARERAALDAPGGAPIAFVEADAQRHDFGGAVFERVISRFGVMFFEDSVAAFANLRRSLVPGGRLTFLCWRPLAQNAWIAVPLAVVQPLVPAPEPSPPGGPGPFRFADPDVIGDILAAAGFLDIGIEAIDRPLVLGLSGEAAAGAAAEAAARFVLELGPVSRLLRDRDDDLRARAHAAVAADFSARAEAGAVTLGAACWLVSGRR